MLKFLRLSKNLANNTLRSLLLIIFCLGTMACSDRSANYPHGKHSPLANTYFSSFSEQPKSLDPAKSYSVDEAVFTAQIYEPPLQYNYFSRPYALEPLTLTQMPRIEYLDKSGKVLASAENPQQIATTVYTMTVKPGIYYQPHPAFAKDAQGNLLYHHLTSADLANINSIYDFAQTGARELTAADYVLEIKQLAAPWEDSPIYGVMAKHIQGFTEFHDALQKQAGSHLDLLQQNQISGVKQLDKYTYQISINGYYSPFIYWLAMSFFAPMPWEALAFYDQAGMRQKSIGLDWYPIGTGPYMLTKNDPNYEMILKRNPNYHTEYFPEIDLQKHPEFKVLAGQRLPLIDTFVFKLEKESIPRWHKFMQGYYDQSGIGTEQFEQAIVFDANGKPDVNPQLKQQGIRLTVDTEPSVFYLGFNMKDPIVGGYSKQARQLRQAISIAVDFNEFINLFLNGRALAAQGPIPPSILPNQLGVNTIDPIVYQNNQGKIVRRDLKQAKELLAQAGYPNGINAKTGQPLVLNYTAVSAGPEQLAQLDWLRKQFGKLGIQLNVEVVQYSRFQDKLRTGNIQLFLMGWNADYPDPENFLFLFYGPNGKVEHGGENVSNYQNPDYDALFRQFSETSDAAQRAVYLQQMLTILQNDAPWVFGFHQQIFLLSHGWVLPRKTHGVANNTLKYIGINPPERAQRQMQWNHAIWWVLWLVLGLFVISMLPAIIFHWRKEHQAPKRFKR